MATEEIAWGPMWTIWQTCTAEHAARNKTKQGVGVHVEWDEE